jgi:hypothetical protein
MDRAKAPAVHSRPGGHGQLSLAPCNRIPVGRLPTRGASSSCPRREVAGHTPDARRPCDWGGGHPARVNIGSRRAGASRDATEDAPDLSIFSRELVSDQSATAAGSARVRRKCPMRRPAATSDLRPDRRSKSGYRSPRRSQAAQALRGGGPCRAVRRHRSGHTSMVDPPPASLIPRTLERGWHQPGGRPRSVSSDGGYTALASSGYARDRHCL